MDLEAGIYHDDPDFDDTVDKLSNDLFQISSTNGKISELLRKTRRRRTAADGDGLVDTTAPAMDLVQTNQQRFRDLKSAIEELQQWQDPSPPHKYSQHKIAADFARLFVEFRNIQEQVLEQARDVKESPVPYRDSVSATNIDAPAGAQLDADTDNNDENEPLLEQSLAFEDQLAQHEVSYQQGLIADREEEIENVAQGMNELNEIYTNLGTIVREQGVTLDNIEANLYNMAGNVRSGAQQLTKAHHWQRRSSGRMCAFLIILLIIAAFIVLAVKI